MERVQGKRVGVESWASKLVVIAIVSVACLFVFESTMVNSGRSEVWKMRERGREREKKVYSGLFLPIVAVMEFVCYNWKGQNM